MTLYNSRGNALMKSIRILDCTLRDGGFVNDWNFGHDCIINILGRLDRAGIDILEVGYLRDGIEYNRDYTEFPNTDAVNDSIEKTSLKGMVVAIIDYGKCSIDSVKERNTSVIDGIRITFRKNEIDEALEFASRVKDKGYKIFLQPVAITDYSAAEVVTFVNKANKLNPYAVCMVDTYGFMNRKDLIRYFYLFDGSLNAEIFLGYHSHNNFQLSYANAIELIEQTSNRGLIIDSSVFGMGKGAGNLNTELITSYINSNIDYKYDISQILEIISIYIEKEKNTHEWGYNLRYFLAASTDTHHRYAQYLISKKTLSIKSINEILMRIKKEKRTRYDEKYIEELYMEYQNVSINDIDTVEDLKEFCKGRKILLLAPGRSIVSEKNKIDDYIINENPLIISINNIIDGFKQDILFVSNSIRYSQIEDETEYYDIDKCGIIATSNISTTALKPRWVVNYSSILAGDNPRVYDNSTLMILKLLIRMGVKKVAIAGFDGFEKNNNYFKKGMALKKDLEERTYEIRVVLNEMYKDIDILYVTTSKYIEGGV